MLRPALFAALFFFAAASPAGASTFTLKDGSRVEGEVVSEKSTFYRVRLADGSEEIVFKSDLSEEPAATGTRFAAEPEGSEDGELVIESAGREGSPEEPEEAARPAPREWLKGTAGYKTALAASPNRAFALYFSAPWCGYCKIFDKQILGSAEVKKYLGGVAKVKLNGDKERELMKKYQVSGYPTFLVVREKDGFQQRIRTGSSPEEFVSECRGAGLGA